MANALRATPPTRPRALIQLLGGMAFGAAVALSVAPFVALPRSLHLGLGGKLLVALGLLLAFPLAVAAHEVGHLAAGKAVGFRALLLVVGPLRVERVGSRFRTRFRLRGMMPGGLAVSVPADTRDLRRRTFWMIAGGPLASLATGVLALAARPFIAGAVEVVVVFAGIVSLLVCLLALIPVSSTGFLSDGQRMTRLVRGGGDVERELALLALVAASMNGQRPREWDAGLVARAAAGVPDTVAGVGGRQLAYAFERDHGRTDAARAHLEAALAAAQLLAPQTRSALMLAAAYFVARFDRDAARARAFLDQAEGELLTQGGSRPLAEAAIAWAEGDHPRAAAHLDAAERALAGTLDAGGRLVALEEIATLRALLG